jgi:hypothetical protein
LILSSNVSGELLLGGCNEVPLVVFVSFAAGDIWVVEGVLLPDTVDAGVEELKTYGSISFGCS